MNLKVKEIEVETRVMPLFRVISTEKTCPCYYCNNSRSYSRSKVILEMKYAKVCFFANTSRYKCNTSFGVLLTEEYVYFDLISATFRLRNLLMILF